MVGLQASGKSTWVAGHLAGTHAVVSKDHWPRARHREARQQRVVAALLAVGRSVVVDNTSPSVAERAPLIALAEAAGVPARAVFLDVPLATCRERNDARTGPARVPLVGLHSAAGRLVAPTTAEGFTEVTVVRPESTPSQAPAASGSVVGDEGQAPS
ncbi:ATP-binding protein [Modestobacter muralis]|uniref:ATP-binding protein n=1 Tax=Modestobacter muralis TaxID=1608614 RepID=A0A6P0H4M4_9ACTN|nr:ATP-binding protein [Modestobacter muralis]NEK93854.1 ATP-binding protein [Modestobacter muralis]NEN50621.1 ATP-binding protein [Modestobacter muralis]